LLFVNEDPVDGLVECFGPFTEFTRKISVEKLHTLFASHCGLHKVVYEEGGVFDAVNDDLNFGVVGDKVFPRCLHATFGCRRTSWNRRPRSPG
jgi:hypothetical protein